MSLKQAAVPVTAQHALGEQPTLHSPRPRDGMTPRVSSSITGHTLPDAPDNSGRAMNLDATDIY